MPTDDTSLALPEEDADQDTPEDARIGTRLRRLGLNIFQVARRVLRALGARFIIPLAVAVLCVFWVIPRIEQHVRERQARADAFETLVTSLQSDPHPRVRKTAALSLLQFDSPEAHDVVAKQLLEQPDLAEFIGLRLGFLEDDLSGKTYDDLLRELRTVTNNPQLVAADRAERVWRLADKTTSMLRDLRRWFREDRLTEREIAIVESLALIEGIDLAIARTEIVAISVAGGRREDQRTFFDRVNRLLDELTRLEALGSPDSVLHLSPTAIVGRLDVTSEAISGIRMALILGQQPGYESETDKYLAIINLLVSRGVRDAMSELERLSRSARAPLSVRVGAVEALGIVGSARQLEGLMQLVVHDNTDLRVAAVAAIGMILSEVRSRASFDAGT